MNVREFFLKAIHTFKYTLYRCTNYVLWVGHTFCYYPVTDLAKTANQQFMFVQIFQTCVNFFILPTISFVKARTRIVQEKYIEFRLCKLFVIFWQHIIDIKINIVRYRKWNANKDISYIMKENEDIPLNEMKKRVYNIICDIL